MNQNGSRMITWLPVFAQEIPATCREGGCSASISGSWWKETGEGGGEKYDDEIDLSLLVPEDDARGQWMEVASCRFFFPSPCSSSALIMKQDMMGV